MPLYPPWVLGGAPSFRFAKGTIVDVTLIALLTRSSSRRTAVAFSASSAEPKNAAESARRGAPGDGVPGGLLIIINKVLRRGSGGCNLMNASATFSRSEVGK